jgi:hypothetical protein
MQVSRILRQTIAHLREVAERTEALSPGALSSLAAT